MNNNVQTFVNKKFGSVRVATLEGEPWFLGKDIAYVLGYKDSNRAILQHVEKQDKKRLNFKGYGDSCLSHFWEPSNDYSTKIIINESGLYDLIFASELPNAREFKHWVTSEVLPAIRKHGAYMTDEKAYDVTHNAAGLADLLQQAAEQLREKDVEIERMKPKELFADSVAASRTTILIGELAKIMRGNGINIGQNRLFAWMRENGYLIARKGSDWNMPTQKAMDLGLFRVKETTINHADGSTTIAKTVKVTGKGQQYFINRFVKGDCNG